MFSLAPSLQIKLFSVSKKIKQSRTFPRSSSHCFHFSFSLVFLILLISHLFVPVSTTDHFLGTNYLELVYDIFWPGRRRRVSKYPGVFSFTGSSSNFTSVIKSRVSKTRCNTRTMRRNSRNRARLHMYSRPCQKRGHAASKQTLRVPGVTRTWH